MIDPDPQPPASSPCQAPPGYWGEEDEAAPTAAPLAQAPAGDAPSVPAQDDKR